MKLYLVTGAVEGPAQATCDLIAEEDKEGAIEAARDNHPELDAGWRWWAVEVTGDVRRALQYVDAN